MQSDSDEDVTDAESTKDTLNTFHDLKKGRRFRSSLWDHFDVISSTAARCKYCSATLSFKSNASNLKKHVKRQHPRMDISSKCQSGIHVKPLRKYEDLVWQTTMSDNDNISGDSHTELQFSKEIMRCFNIDNDMSQCLNCFESVPNSIEEMKNHLDNRHSKIMDNIIAKVQQDDTNDENNPIENDKEVYTQNVYIVNETNPLENTKRLKKKRQSTESMFKKRPRLIKMESNRNSTIECVKQAKYMEKPNKLQSFFDYQAYLMETVPSKVLPELQLEMIKLIVKAQQKTDGNCEKCNVKC